jgi:hypothetical protein
VKRRRRRMGLERERKRSVREWFREIAALRLNKNKKRKEEEKWV